MSMNIFSSARRNFGKHFSVSRNLHSHLHHSGTGGGIRRYESLSIHFIKCSLSTSTRYYHSSESHLYCSQCTCATAYPTKRLLSSLVRHYSSVPRSGFVEILGTPNPKSLQFKPMQPLFEGTNIDPSRTFNFSRPMDAIKSPLASRIFKNPWVTNVMIANDYFSVSISDEEQWHGIQLDISSMFQEWAMSGENVMDEDIVIHDDTQINDDDDEVVAAIKEVLETRIRPVVQKDGGDIRFIEFNDEGIVYLEMTGSCKGCPSSTMTLKNGIENMLQHFVPEVAEVRQIESETDKVSNEAFEQLERKLEEN